MSILLVEQYLDFARGLADRFYIMDRGIRAEIHPDPVASGSMNLEAATQEEKLGLVLPVLQIRKTLLTVACCKECEASVSSRVRLT